MRSHSVNIQFRVGKFEYAKLEEIAKERGVPLNTLMRNMAVDLIDNLERTKEKASGELPPVLEPSESSQAPATDPNAPSQLSSEQLQNHIG